MVGGQVWSKEREEDFFNQKSLINIKEPSLSPLERQVSISFF